MWFLVYFLQNKPSWRLEHAYLKSLWALDFDDISLPLILLPSCVLPYMLNRTATSSLKTYRQFATQVAEEVIKCNLWRTISTQTITIKEFPNATKDLKCCVLWNTWQTCRLIVGRKTLLLKFGEVEFSLETSERKWAVRKKSQHTKFRVIAGKFTPYINGN
jgi:hypothetical protein